MSRHAAPTPPMHRTSTGRALAVSGVALVALALTGAMVKQQHGTGTVQQTSPRAQRSTPVMLTPRPASSPHGSARPPLAYTVKSGDNLTMIAAWFRLHGYGDLYRVNRQVIGDNPDLIHPGQVITVSTTGMSITR